MDIHLMLPLLCKALLTIAAIVVVAEDARRYIIPNWLNGVIIALYTLAAFFLPTDPLMALAAASIFLVFGLGLFALGAMGGGDVKLTFALMLWTGWHAATVQFLFLFALVGGLLVLIVLFARRTLSPGLMKKNPARTLPRILIRRQPVPYGLAIAPAFVWLMWQGMIPMLG